MIKRILTLATQAMDENPHQAWLDSQWYETAGSWCALLDADYELIPGTTAGFMAALSPLNAWHDQLRFTPPSIAAGLELIRSGHSAFTAIRGPGFNSNKDKASRILAGESPLDVLGGDKVRSFYLNLTGDFSAVTIDRHALAIAGWEKSLTSNAYARISFAFRMAGESLDMSGAECQALTWAYWRRTHSAFADNNRANGR